MKLQKRRTLSTAVIAAVLSLGLAGASWAASEESSQDPVPNLPQIMQNMMEDAHFMGPRHRGRRGMRGPRPYSARPLVSIALRSHEELKLTDDQIIRLKDIRDAFSKKSVKERAEMKTRRIDLKRALDTEKIDLTGRGEENTRGFEHAGGFEDRAPQGDSGGKIRPERRAAEAAIENRPEAPGPRPQVP